MNQKNIIYGNIKSENIQIFLKNFDYYLAKMTDFGYFFLFTNKSDFISIPRSKFWTVLETKSHWKILSQRAKKIDIYSFNILYL